MVDFDLPENRPQRQREAAIDEIEKMITERRRQRQFVLDKTQEFTERLYSAMRNAIRLLRERGLTELGEPRLVDHPAGASRQALQISIEDWSLIFVPLVGVARPTPRDEAQITGAFFKQNCGRIAIFIGNDPSEEAFYDFLILADGSWFAWGYGWPRQASTIDETDFDDLAYALLHSFIKDIFMTWHTRAETTLGVAMDARKRAYQFGLPGHEL